MKKCASCTKDLPDAALHCVFCGAKQPPAPATGGGLAKTVMGYSASEMIEQMKQQTAGASPAARSVVPGNLPPTAAQQPYQPPRPPVAGAQPPAGPQSSVQYAPTAYQQAAPAGPYQPPQPAYQPPQPAYQPPGPASYQHQAQHPPMQPAPHYPQPGPQVPVSGPSGPTLVPTAGSVAPTMFVQGNAPPQQPPRPMPVAQQATQIAPPPPQQPMAMPMPMPHQPMIAPPFLSAQTGARAGRPIEPWRDSLRLHMFVWGAALLVAFAIPVATDPLVFNWDTIIKGAGTQKLPPLIMVAIGLLSVAIAAIPTSPAPRGMIAALLGLTGVFTPILLAGLPEWKTMLLLAGAVLLIPGLVVRSEYRDSPLPRILVTVAVLAMLAPFVIPEGGQLPLVNLVEAVIDTPGSMKVPMILMLAYIVLVVLCLLAWLPSPSSGGAQVFAWILILWPIAVLLVGLILRGNIGSAVGKQPGMLVSWVAGIGQAGGGKGAGAALLGIGLGVSYAVLIGYGVATVVGKKLE